MLYCHQILMFSCFFEGASTRNTKVPKRSPREAKIEPRRAPDGAQDGPRGAKSGPRCLQEPPRAPQEGTQSTPEPVPERPGQPPGADLAPKSLPKGFSKRFWPPRGPFWTLRKSIFEASSMYEEGSAAGAQPLDIHMRLRSSVS